MRAWLWAMATLLLVRAILYHATRSDSDEYPGVWPGGWIGRLRIRPTGFIAGYVDMLIREFWSWIFRVGRWMYDLGDRMMINALSNRWS